MFMLRGTGGENAFSVAENLIFEMRGPRAVTSAIVIIVVFAAAVIIVTKIIFIIVVIVAIFIIMVVIIIMWHSEHTRPVVQTDDNDSARVHVPAHARTEFAPIPLIVFAIRGGGCSGVILRGAVALERMDVVV